MEKKTLDDIIYIAKMLEKVQNIEEIFGKFMRLSENVPVIFDRISELPAEMSIKIAKDTCEFVDSVDKLSDGLTAALVMLALKDEDK